MEITAGHLATVALTLAFAFVIYHWRATSWRIVPEGIPWMPTDLPWSRRLLLPFTRIRAHLRDFQGGTDLVKQGYEKVPRTHHGFSSF